MLMQLFSFIFNLKKETGWNRIRTHDLCLSFKSYVSIPNSKFYLLIPFSNPVYLIHYFCYRYGDMLNPWADLITMARAWCLVKPGGLALVGVPTGPDMIVFNSDKVYGPILYSHIFANWKQVLIYHHF